MHVIITGATGLIGKHLCAHLLRRGHTVTAVSRNAAQAQKVMGHPVNVIEWPQLNQTDWSDKFEDDFAIVNLAGESISSMWWTTSKRAKILQSRIKVGQSLVKAVSRSAAKPRLVIQASAIGFYGHHTDITCDESSANGRGFLASITRQWEDSTKLLQSEKTRHVIIRSGIVLSQDGGALPKFLTQFKLYVGGVIGKGSRWFSWIHIQDEVSAIRFLLEKNDSSGVYNLTSPNPVTMAEFCSTLGNELHKPAWLHTPGLPLKIVFGLAAKELLLADQRVIPRRLTEAGFSFEFPTIKEALRTIHSKE